MTRLVVDLRGRGYDVLTTEEAGKDTASDEDQLAFATAENSQQLGSRQYGLLFQRMLRLLNHFTAEEMFANLVHLEQFK